MEKADMLWTNSKHFSLDKINAPPVERATEPLLTFTNTFIQIYMKEFFYVGILPDHEKLKCE